MTDERRYSDDEVAHILDRAAEVSAGGSGTSSPGAGGLTLRELEEIGREVGIPAEAIARAAADVDLPAPAPGPERRFLGQTIGVSRSIDLPRRLTDEEWQRVVVELRETFDAKGRISTEGGFRQWTNGNLHVLLEPYGAGERLRLRTLKGNARPYQTIGISFMAFSGTLGLLSQLGLSVDPPGALLFLMGAAFFFTSRLTVPSWARARTQEFEAVIERVRSTVASGALPEGGGRTLGPPPDTEG